MKKYIVFAFSGYYPLGGMSDIADSFDTLEEAIDYQTYVTLQDYCYIVDRDTWEIIKESRSVS